MGSENENQPVNYRGNDPSKCRFSADFGQQCAEPVKCLPLTDRTLNRLLTGDDEPDENSGLDAQEDFCRAVFAEVGGRSFHAALNYNFRITPQSDPSVPGYLGLLMFTINVATKVDGGATAFHQALEAACDGHCTKGALTELNSCWERLSEWLNESGRVPLCLPGVQNHLTNISHTVNLAVPSREDCAVMGQKLRSIEFEDEHQVIAQLVRTKNHYSEVFQGIIEELEKSVSNGWSTRTLNFWDAIIDELKGLQLTAAQREDKGDSLIVCLNDGEYEVFVLGSGEGLCPEEIGFQDFDYDDRNIKRGEGEDVEGAALEYARGMLDRCNNRSSLKPWIRKALDSQKPLGLEIVSEGVFEASRVAATFALAPILSDEKPARPVSRKWKLVDAGEVELPSYSFVPRPISVQNRSFN